jgi:hypothetical protein
MEASEEDKLPDSEVVGQVVSYPGNFHVHFLTSFLTDVVCIFSFLKDSPNLYECSYLRTLIFAAMDTTTNALSRSLQLLATHPEVQEKLRQEILTALEENGGQDLSYDEMVSLPFLDAVCRETLRL